MDVPNLFSAAPPEQEKVFLALLITDATVQAGLWRVSQGQLTIDHFSEIKSHHDQESLAVATDQGLQELGKASENVSEVVFGFESNWVNEQGIVDEKKPILKKLTSDLSLKPVGFVVTNEALFQYLQKQQPTISALLFVLSPQQVSVMLITKGTLAVTEKVGRSQDLASDVTEALARFSQTAVVGTLPGKMIIASLGVERKELVKQQQSLTKHDWQQSHDFLHPPVIEMMDSETVFTAIVQEGGKAVAQSQGIQVGGLQGAAGLVAAQTGGIQSAGFAAASVPEGDGFADDYSSLGDAKETAVDSSLDQDSVSGVQIGSASEMDDASFAQAAVQVSSANMSPLAALVARVQSVFKKVPGFSKSGTKKASNADVKEAVGIPPVPVSQTSSLPPKHSTPKPKKAKTSGDGTSSWFQTHRSFMIGGFVAGLLALLFIGLGVVFASKQAEVLLELDKKTIAKEVAITLDPTISESDPEDLLLKAEIVTKTVNGSKTVDATGVKLVGERATGRVKIFNKTDSEKTFGAGTVLTYNSLSFTLDEEVRIASSSVEQKSSGETKTYGSAEVGVTAAQIGAESNIPGESEMVVDGFATGSYSASSLEQFSGGSSREVRVVGKEDRATVLNELRQELLDQATEAFKGESGQGRFLIPTGNSEVLSTDYNAEIGDEVSSVTLDLELEVEAVAYAQDDVKPLVSQVLEPEVPANYKLDTSNPTILTSPNTDASPSGSVSRLVLDANISSFAVPVLQEEALKSEIGGQSIESAEAILRGKAEITEATIKIRPWLAKYIFRSVPKNQEKILFNTDEQAISGDE